MAYFLIDRYHVDATGKTYYAVFDVTTLQSQWLCEEDLISFTKKSRVNGVSSDGTFTLTPLDKVANTAMAFAKLNGASWLAKETGVYYIAYGGSVLKADFKVIPDLPNSKPYNIIFPSGVDITSHEVLDAVRQVGQDLLINLLYIPESLTLISDNEFFGAHFLNEVSFPVANNMYTVYLRDNSFSRTVFDKGINFPKGRLFEFGDQSFAQSNITELVCSPSSIGVSAFLYCNCLSRVELYIDSIVRVHDCAFSGCFALKEVTMHLFSGVEFGDYVLQDCISLSKFDIIQEASEGAYSLGSYCFSGCTDLKSITLPRGLRGLGTGVFFNCPSLRSIRLDFLDENFIHKFLSDIVDLEKHFMDITYPNDTDTINEITEFCSHSVLALIGVSRKCKFTIRGDLSSDVKAKAEWFIKCLLEEYAKHKLFYEDLMQLYSERGGLPQKMNYYILDSVLNLQLLNWINEISSSDYEWSFGAELDNIRYQR